MPDKYQNKYRIPSARLQSWDYGSNAAYFVTICTKHREYYFGEIANHEMQLNEIGKLANQFWIEIPNHFPFIQLGNFVVMPNHTHGILIIDKIETANETANGTAIVDTTHALSLRDHNHNHNHPNPSNETEKTIGQQRFQNQGKNSLSSIIGSYKSAVTKHAHRIGFDFAWQSRFHDSIIRNSRSFERVQNYIANNPKNWKEDNFFHK